MNQPVGYYMYGASFNVAHLHRYNLAVNQAGFQNNVMLAEYPWETPASLAAAVAQRAQTFTTEIL